MRVVQKIHRFSCQHESACCDHAIDRLATDKTSGSVLARSHSDGKIPHHAAGFPEQRQVGVHEYDDRSDARVTTMDLARCSQASLETKICLGARHHPRHMHCVPDPQHRVTVRFQAVQLSHASHERDQEG